jgi:hypothetical protein
LAILAIGAVLIALASAACFAATVGSVRPRGRAHPYALRANFRREGLMPAFLNFCAQVPNTGFSTFLPLWAIGRGVGNPGVLFVGSEVGAIATPSGSGRTLAQLLGPWGLGFAAATWGLGGALVAAATVPLLGAATCLAYARGLPAPP